MTRRHHHTAIIAITVALTATLAPAAWADPAPLARAEAAIANAPTHAAAGSGPCSEVCSAGGYGSASQTAWTPDDSGATLPHNPRLRPTPLSQTEIKDLSQIQRGAEQAGLHPGVFGPSQAASLPPTLVRIAAPSGGFNWGDAGIGAGGMLALALIGIGGALVATRRRSHRVSDQHAS